MTEYQAMMKAADFIEKNPHRYSFMSITVPSEFDDSVGCMIGWTNYFFGFSPGVPIECTWNDSDSLGRATWIFYNYKNNFPSCDVDDPEKAAQHMRLFAEEVLKAKE